MKKSCKWMGDLQLLGGGGGKTGIRTLGTRKGTTVFETVPIDHSGIFPFLGWVALRAAVCGRAAMGLRLQSY